MLKLLLWLVVAYAITNTTHAQSFKYQLARQYITKLSVNVSQKKVEYGTGIILGYHQKMCLAATAYHVVKMANKQNVIQITLNTGKSYQALLKHKLPAMDIAILAFPLDQKHCPDIQFADTLKIASDVYALGNAHNQGIALSKGIISRLDFFDGEKLLETDVLVVHGSSGGGLFNSSGELTGIIVSVGMNRHGGISGFSYAVPYPILKKLLADIKYYERIRTVTLGVTLLDTQTLDEQNPLKQQGLLIQTVIDHDLAKHIKGGNCIVPLKNGSNYLQGGDFLLKINNRKVYDEKMLNYVLATTPYHQNITLTLKRANKEFTYTHIKIPEVFP